MTTDRQSESSSILFSRLSGLSKRETRLKVEEDNKKIVERTREKKQTGLIRNLNPHNLQLGVNVNVPRSSIPRTQLTASIPRAQLTVNNSPLSTVTTPSASSHSSPESSPPSGLSFSHFSPESSPPSGMSFRSSSAASPPSSMSLSSVSSAGSAYSPLDRAITPAQTPNTFVDPEIYVTDTRLFTNKPITVWDKEEKIIRAFESKGSKLTFACGGNVRDSLIGRDIVKEKRIEVEGEVQIIDEIDADFVTDMGYGTIMELFGGEYNITVTPPSDLIPGTVFILKQKNATYPVEEIQILQSKFFTDPKYKDKLKADAQNRDLPHNAAYRRHGRTYIPLPETKLAFVNREVYIINRKELFDFEARKYEKKDSSEAVASKHDLRIPFRGIIPVVTYPHFNYSIRFNHFIQNEFYAILIKKLALINSTDLGILNNFLWEKIFSRAQVIQIFYQFESQGRIANAMFPNLMDVVQKSRDAREKMVAALNRVVNLEKIYAHFVVLENLDRCSKLSDAELKNDKTISEIIQLSEKDNPLYKNCFDRYRAQLRYKPGISLENICRDAIQFFKEPLKLAEEKEERVPLLTRVTQHSKQVPLLSPSGRLIAPVLPASSLVQHSFYPQHVTNMPLLTPLAQPLTQHSSSNQMRPRHSSFASTG